MKYLFLLFAFFYFTPSGFSQTRQIMTIVGNGYPMDTGDGGLATRAGLSVGVPSIPDVYGNLFLCNRLTNNTVRKVNSSGYITLIAGNNTSLFSGDGGAATLAGLNDPIYAAVDLIGNIYIAENTGNRIRKIDAGTGIISTFAGTGASGFSGEGSPATATDFGGVSSIAFDKSGNLYACVSAVFVVKIDARTSIVSKIAGTGTAIITSGDGGLATAATGNFSFLCIDKHENVYVSNENNSIRKIDSGTNIIHTIAGRYDSAAYIYIKIVYWLPVHL